MGWVKEFGLHLMARIVALVWKNKCLFFFFFGVGDVIIIIIIIIIIVVIVIVVIIVVVAVVVVVVVLMSVYDSVRADAHYPNWRAQGRRASPGGCERRGRPHADSHAAIHIVVS
jgi:hypothetical protein